MQRLYENKAGLTDQSERGMVEAPWSAVSASHFRVAREDRDGCSRYRASKMSLPFQGRIRVVPRVVCYPRPYLRIGAFFFLPTNMNLLFGGNFQ